MVFGRVVGGAASGLGLGFGAAFGAAGAHAIMNRGRGGNNGRNNAPQQIVNCNNCRQNVPCTQFCSSCGFEMMTLRQMQQMQTQPISIPAQGNQAPVQVQAVAPADACPFGLKCECGAMNEQGWKFCCGCAKELKPMPPVCSKCNTVGNVGDKFCRSCGNAKS